MTVIYLLRHGETQWNQDGNRYCGRTDIPLSETGRGQALRTREVFTNIPLSAIYVSPLQRSRETATLIAQPHPQVPLQTNERLTEIDFGLWEGKTKTQIEQDDPQTWDAWLQDPGNVRAGQTGETAGEVFERASSLMKEIRDRHPNDQVLVVGHNTFNRIFQAGALGLPFREYRSLTHHNAGITTIETSDSGFHFVQSNKTDHLI